MATQCTFTPLAEKYATLVPGEVLLNATGMEVATLRPLASGKWSVHVIGGTVEVEASREDCLEWLRVMYPQFKILEAKHPAPRTTIALTLDGVGL